MSIGYDGESFNLLITQGADYGPVEGQVLTAAGKPYDLTGCTLDAVLRKSMNSTTSYGAISVAITDAATGKYQLSMQRAITTLLPCGDSVSDAKSKYVWQLRITESNGRISQLAKGEAAVSKKLI